MNPQYTDAHLKEYYSHYTVDEPWWDEPLAYCHNFYLSLVERYLPPPGRLLDIGSGKGALLAAAQKRGWTPVGYDVDPSSVERVGRHLGVDIRSGDFFAVDWPAQHFDVVTMHHVLEHLKDPLPYLRRVRSLLRAGGIFFLVLPNIRSVSSSIKFWMEKRGWRRRRVGAYYDTEHHLWYFTPATLRHLLEREGFEILRVRSGHQARPHQSSLKRFVMRNITERPLWKSTFLTIARKTS
ncbi:MAG TPA: class I SAM-dependent methyltransferase [Elusimicrobiota bacterium]|nr:class I SAM-dependent methyltransferase [Elusimicrobiota bacterium]